MSGPPGEVPRVRCRVCDKPVPADGVSMRSLLATCASCHAVFDISERVFELAARKRTPGDAGARVDSVPVQRQRDQVELPPGIALERSSGAAADVAGGPFRMSGRVRDDLYIERRWRAGSNRAMFVFTAVWLGFLIVWYWVAGSRGDWVMMVFPILHLAVAAVLIYQSLTALLNRTQLTLRGEALDIEHGPLPWPGNRRLAVADLAQLYCQERVRGASGSRKIMAYDVIARLANGRDVELVPGCNLPEQALFIEQVMEECLGIVDVRIVPWDGSRVIARTDGAAAPSLEAPR